MTFWEHSPIVIKLKMINSSFHLLTNATKNVLVVSGAIDPPLKQYNVF